MPEGFVEAAEDGSLVCGELEIESPPDPAAPGLTFVRVLGIDGKRHYEAHGRRQRGGGGEWRQSLRADYCGDLTGDGVPELVMTESSGGAHCCYTHYVVSLTPQPKRLLMWEKGDGGTPLLPVKLVPGSTWQLQGRVVFWPPFDVDHGEPVLSYASAPVVPAVLSLVGGEYALTSLSFVVVYRKERDEIRQRCATPGACDTSETAIHAWVDALAVGDWDVDRAEVADEALRAVLDRRSVATRKKLERELGSLAAPASLGPRR